MHRPTEDKPVIELLRNSFVTMQSDQGLYLVRFDFDAVTNSFICLCQLNQYYWHLQMVSALEVNNHYKGVEMQVSMNFGQKVSEFGIFPTEATAGGFVDKLSILFRQDGTVNTLLIGDNLLIESGLGPLGVRYWISVPALKAAYPKAKFKEGDAVTVSARNLFSPVVQQVKYVFSLASGHAAWYKVNDEWFPEYRLSAFV